MPRMTKEQAIERLNALDGGDPEVAHGRADDILLELVGKDVRDAYNDLVGRCSFWAHA